MSISSKEFKIQRKYKELPEQPRYKKKKKKISVKRSNHKHIYNECLFSFCFFGEPYMGAGTYCTICGRIGDIDVASKVITNNDLPIFNIDDFLAKEVKLPGTSES